MHAGSNGRNRSNGHRESEAKTGARPRRRPIRAILGEGLEAALRADPEVLANCKPKTGAGQIVRSLVLEAGKGKATALKTLMSLVDREPDAEESEESQGILDEPCWDWSADGVWETLPEAKEEDEDEDEDEDVVDDRWEGGSQAELQRRLRLLMRGNDADRARAAAIMAKMRSMVEEDIAAAVAA